MESNIKTQWYVGLFVVIGLVVIMGSIFMLGGNRALFKSFATLTADFDQVQGLNIGSIVSLSGVNIGNVQRIDFVPGQNVLKVTFRIETSFLPRITQGSQVEIRTQGALGDKFIFVSPGPATASPLQSGDALTVAQATDLFNLISERGKETEKIFDIISDVHRISKTLGSGDRLEKMMANFSHTSANLAEASAQTRVLMASLNASNTHQQLKSSVEKLENILNKVDKGQGTLGALINDSTVHSQLKQFLGGSQRKEHLKNLIRTSIERSETASHERP